MFNIATLRHLARSMDEEAFALRTGPFMLVRKPDAAQLARKMMSSTGRTVQVKRTAEATQARVLEFLIDFEDLELLPAAAGKDAWRVGRDTRSEFWLDDSSVSSNHALIDAVEDGGFVLFDAESTNGTFVNERPVDGRTELPDGAVLAFGDATFWFVKTPTLYQHLIESA